MSDDQPDGLPTADDILDDADVARRIEPTETPEETDADLGDGARLISGDVSCENCAHKDVCSLLQGIAPMLQSWEPGEPPIDLQELAVICDAFLPEEEVSQ